MKKPEEKKAIPASDDSADRRTLPDRRCGIADRRKQPDRRNSITDFKTNNSIDRRILPDRRCLSKKEIALK